MDQTARRRRRNLIQNIAIALLSVSAVLLFAQLQLYNLGTSEDPLYLERLTARAHPPGCGSFPLRYGWSSRTPTAGMAAWASLPTVTASPPWPAGGSGLRPAPCSFYNGCLSGCPLGPFHLF